ncbi:hypothetical protein Ahy_A04g017423 isoform A [Arachis hypogaea]|uniref:G domain-containing protein n=1 Tax=Arachis hypogaea TaxID=3818 RepID=A0A445DB04_ARAHY|nr:hypothetical protein Ahy_A04g017423 isoform A [Arachis hypogaea]
MKTNVVIAHCSAKKGKSKALKPKTKTLSSSTVPPPPSVIVGASEDSLFALSQTQTLGSTSILPWLLCSSCSPSLKKGVRCRLDALRHPPQLSKGLDCFFKNLSYVLLARIIHSPLSNPSYSFRATAASPSSHCRVRPSSSAVVRSSSSAVVRPSVRVATAPKSPTPLLSSSASSPHLLLSASSCHRLHLLAVVWSVSSINQGSVGVVFEGYNEGRPVRAGIVGYPNVGKSSLINRLLK